MKGVQIQQHLRTIETTIGDLIEVLMQIAQDEGVPQNERGKITSQALSQILLRAAKSKENLDEAL